MAASNSGVQLLEPKLKLQISAPLASAYFMASMTMAVHAIGSTPTAIMGALEPLSAVIIGVTVFGEIFTLRLGIGIFMILVAVILIVAAKSFSPRKIVSFIGHVVHTVPVRRK